MADEKDTSTSALCVCSPCYVVSLRMQLCCASQWRFIVPIHIALKGILVISSESTYRTILNWHMYASNCLILVRITPLHIAENFFAHPFVSLKNCCIHRAVHGELLTSTNGVLFFMLYMFQVLSSLSSKPGCACNLLIDRAFATCGVCLKDLCV